MSHPTGIKEMKKLCNQNHGPNLFEDSVKSEATLTKLDEDLLAESHKEFKNKLKYFYKEIFPFEDMCTWLSYGNLHTLQGREFRLLRNHFRQWKTFKHVQEMKLEISNICPVKIDVGAIYNKRLEKKTAETQPAHPIERELIFDIDLSNYNTVRTCCKDTNICQKCWKFAAVAVKILHTSFVEDYGWKHILWVFSGGRNIHCWICDPDVRRLTAQQRKQILNYYSLPKPGLVNHDDCKGSKRKPLGLFSHNLMRRSYVLAEEYFVNVCLNEQNVLRTTESVSEFMSLLPSIPCRQKVTELFADCSSSLEKWTKFEEYWKSEEQSQTSLWNLRPHLPKHIVLYYLYPRINVAVSTAMNHFLKAPLSFHPGTFLLCTPFDPLKVDEFNVSEVPSLKELFKAAKVERPSSEISPTEKIQRLRYEESGLVFTNFVKALKTSWI